MDPAHVRNAGAKSSCEGYLDGAPVLVTTERMEEADESVDAIASGYVVGSRWRITNKLWRGENSTARGWWQEQSFGL